MSDLTALALNAAATLSPWELHGVVCGLVICGREEVGREEFAAQELVDLVGTEALTDQSSVEVFVNSSARELLAEDLSFTLLLPDDDAPLGFRIAALAEWSASFLAGFGVTMTYLGWEALPEEAQEVIDDLTAITELDSVDLADGVDDGDTESDLLQVQEFVKVGVLLILGLLDGDHAE